MTNEFYLIQSHGFEQLVTFSNLKSLGIVTEQETGSQAGTPLNKVASGMAAMTRRSTFQSLCKKLSLVRICEIGTHRYNIKPSVQTYVLISIQGKTKYFGEQLWYWNSQLCM